jgi:hypothetical protein
MGVGGCEQTDGVVVYRSAKMPADTEKQVLSDYERMTKTTPLSPEHGQLRAHLQLMAELPWAIETTGAAVGMGRAWVQHSRQRLLGVLGVLVQS